MDLLIEFLITFGILLIFFFLLIYVREKRRIKRKEEHTYEVNAIFNLYRLDIKKVNMNLVLIVYTIALTINFSILVTGIALLKKVWLEILVGLFVTPLVFVISYYILKWYFNKKGWIKHVK